MFAPMYRLPMGQGMMMGMVPTRMVAAGAFPVPGAMQLRDLPPAVRANINRLAEAPPKPAVTLPVMNEAAATMIAPDLPCIADV